MKKALVLLLTLALALSMCACGKKVDDAADNTTESSLSTSDTTDNATDTTEESTSDSTENSTPDTTEESASDTTEDSSNTEESAPSKPHTHDYTASVTVQPECEKAGIQAFNCACGDSYTEPIEALNHSWDIWKSTDVSGILARICENCGDTETKAGYLEMKVLSIGNSYSQDAQRYLHQIAEADGFDLQCANLYASGCSLEMHYNNMLSEAKAYDYDVNGAVYGPDISLKTALQKENWDVVTLQQVSGSSPKYSTYQPYLNELVAYVRQYAPNAKIVIHQTWAYEKNSWKLSGAGYGSTENGKMLTDIVATIAQAAEDVGADYIIPSGELFGLLLENGVTKLYRDTYHSTYGIGRYALGLLWYRALTGNDVSVNTFSDFEETVTDQQVATIKSCVATIAAQYGL